MRKVAAIVLAAMLSEARADESWFDGHWVLDRDATLSAISQAADERVAELAEDPETRSKVSVAQIRQSMDKALPASTKAIIALWDANGDPELDVDSGTISGKYRGTWFERVPYSLRPIEPGVFEVVSTFEGRQWRSLVRRTPAGFCRVLYGPYEDPLGDDSVWISRECFRRHREGSGRSKVFGMSLWLASGGVIAHRV